VCVCGSSYNQHCSAAFGMPLVLTKQAQHPSYPLLWCLAHPTAIVPISQCCVCVWFQLQSTLLRCFFGKPLELTKPAPHPSYPLLWCLAHPTAIVPITQCCVCVCGSSYNQHCSAAFWQAFGADKTVPTSIYAHLHTFEHFCAFILLSFSIFLSYFLLSQSFFLTFSFLNLSLLLSPFSIFLSYFLLFLSFSVYVAAV